MTIDQNKRAFYDKLHLGAYSDAAKEALHMKPIDELTKEEAVKQLNVYASWGQGTLFNKQLQKIEKSDGTYRHPFPTIQKFLNEKQDNKEWKEQKVFFENAVEAIETVDCIDAGLPLGDKKEVDPCFELKDALFQAYSATENLLKLKK